MLKTAGYYEAASRPRHQAMLLYLGWDILGAHVRIDACDRPNATRSSGYYHKRGVGLENSTFRVGAALKWSGHGGRKGAVRESARVIETAAPIGDCGVPNVSCWHCLRRPTSHGGPSQPLCEVGSTGVSQMPSPTSPGCSNHRHLTPTGRTCCSLFCRRHGIANGTYWPVLRQLDARQRMIQEVKATRSTAGCPVLPQHTSASFDQSCSEKLPSLPGPATHHT